MRDSLAEFPGTFAPALTGFEDVEHGRGVAVRIAPGSRTDMVEAYGSQPETRIAALGPCVRQTASGDGPPIKDRRDDLVRPLDPYLDRSPGAENARSHSGRHRLAGAP